MRRALMFGLFCMACGMVDEPGSQSSGGAQAKGASHAGKIGSGGSTAVPASAGGVGGERDDSVGGKPDDSLGGKPGNSLAGKPDDSVGGKPDESLGGAINDWGGGGTAAGKAGTGGGGQTPIGELPPPEEQIVFEVRSTDFAWVPFNAGVFVKASGDIVQFDLSDAPRTWPPARPSHAQLLQAYGTHLELVGAVPAAELAAKRALIAEAAAGVVLVNSACYDFGDISYTAWEMNEHGVYRDYDLGATGDMPRKNLAPAALELVAWLAQTTGIGGTVCAFRTNVCDPAGAPPRNPMSCDSVPDCSWCGDHFLCVAGPDGEHHCTLAGCTNDQKTCDCNGEAVCAGGSDRCRELPEGALTCQ